MTTRYQNQLNRTYEAQTKLMEQSDGAKLHRPSDDAIGYSKYLRYSISYGENNQYQTNVKTAISWMKNSDSSLVDITNCFKTIIEKANQAQGTNTDSDMKAIAQEMLVQAQQSVADANTQINGRYLFSGQRDLVQPYTISYDTKYERGLTKTLDDKQAAYFSDSSQSSDIKQMLVLEGDDGNKYFLNTKTGRVFTENFVEEGYKEKITEGQTTETKPLNATDAGNGVQADQVGVTENTNYHHYEQRLVDSGIDISGTDFANEMGYTKPNEEMVIVKDKNGKIYYGDSNTGKVYEVNFVNSYVSGNAIKSVGTYPSETFAPAPRTSSANAPENYDPNSYGMYVLKGVDGNTYFAEPSTGAITDEAHIASVARPLTFEQSNSGDIIGDLYAQNQKYTYDSVVELDNTVVTPPGFSQRDYFGEKDFVKVTDANGDAFYYSPTTHDVYTEDFYTNGWKDSDTTKVKTKPYYEKGADAVDSMDALYVAENFDSRGIIKNNDTAKASGANWKTSYIINGRTISMTLSTVSQYIVTYQGDKKRFSMVKENGEVQPATDTVNASGVDIAGYSIFDNPESGNEYSGANAFNDMLTVVAMCERGEKEGTRWMSSDGKTLANNAYNTVLNAESRLAARQQVYSDCSDMLVTQNETILGDITDVHSTDVAKLAVEMMTAQTIYQLSLSVGSRILPPTLADYL